MSLICWIKFPACFLNICTVNTDKAEAEIKSLKEKKEKLEQQINQASGDPAKQDRLQKQLQQVGSELLMKDNDACKKKNA